MANEYKRDWFFASIGVVLWVATVPMLFLGIWLDWRWWATAVACFVVGFMCGVLSVAIDKRLIARGVRK